MSPFRSHFSQKQPDKRVSEIHPFFMLYYFYIKLKCPIFRNQVTAKIRSWFKARIHHLYSSTNSTQHLSTSWASWAAVHRLPEKFCGPSRPKLHFSSLPQSASTSRQTCFWLSNIMPSDTEEGSSSAASKMADLRLEINQVGPSF